jgi:hypothetical protein
MLQYNIILSHFAVGLKWEDVTVDKLYMVFVLFMLMGTA